MGCFYVGFRYKQRKNGVLKIGETGYETPANRLGQIRRVECFQCLGWIHLIGETRSQRLYVESYVRMKMEQKGLSHFGNDHFAYAIEEGMKYEQADYLSVVALHYAEEACKQQGIQYEYGRKQYKRGRAA